MLQLAEVDWNAVFQPGNMVFFPGGMGILVGAVAIVGGIYMGIKNHQRDVLLKRDMVAKGYSVDEIERVLGAKSPKK